MLFRRIVSGGIATRITTRTRAGTRGASTQYHTTTELYGLKYYNILNKK